LPTVRYLCDRSGVEPFEVQQNQLSLEWFKSVNHRHQVFTGPAIVELLFVIDAVRHCRQLVEANETGSAPSPPDHLRRRDVVRDPVDPGAQRAPSVEGGKAAPHGEVDLLEQVEARIGVGFVGARQPLERGAIRRSCLGVQTVLT
jgi:hypothetical protein